MSILLKTENSCFTEEAVKRHDELMSLIFDIFNKLDSKFEMLVELEKQGFSDRELMLAMGLLNHIFKEYKRSNIGKMLLNEVILSSQKIDNKFDA